jgi:hypothetical protein
MSGFASSSSAAEPKTKPEPGPKTGGQKVGTSSAAGGGAAETDVLQSILRSLAPSDAQHDFGNDKPTAPQEQEAYNKGLYRISGNEIEYKTEAQSLSSVVKNPSNYVPINAANPNKDFCHTSTHNIETVNGNNYAVKYADVKWEKKAIDTYGKPNFESTKAAINAEKRKNIETSKASKEKLQVELDEIKKQEKKGFIDNIKDIIDKIKGKHKEEAPKIEVDREEIDAPMFYEMMGIDVNETIALVIDAASIGLIDILSRGKFTRGKRPTVYYIYGPEVVHDPATKKHPSSPEFKDPETWDQGVKFIPCVSLNPSSFVYSYDYNPSDTTGLYLNKFFTNFQFELSELKETPKGKTIEYSTDLTIKAFDGDNIKFIDESIDSKSKSDITFLTKIIGVLKGAFKSGDEKEFQYAISFLKKMSGDWLQVLLTLAIATGTRGFTPYKGASQQNITGKIDHVYFVTHDQIALAFALMMKVECLFTHHGPVEGNPSLHSAFLFSLPNEESLNASIIAKAEALDTNYEDDITNLTTDLTTYNENYNTALSGPIEALDKFLDVVPPIEKITEPSKSQSIEKIIMHVDKFDKLIQTTFTTALKIVAIKKVLPNLLNVKDLINDLKTQNKDLSRKFKEFKKQKDKDAQIARKLLEMDGRITAEIENIRKLIESANKFFLTSGDGIMEINKKIRDFTKTLIYTSADKWTWDSPEVSNRSLSKLTNNVNETQAFNADRNIFVIHLNALDDETKSKITLLFAKCYIYINDPNPANHYVYTPIKKKGGENVTQDLTTTQLMKFKPMATTFCYEVFINFGGKFSGTNLRNGGITHREIDEYCGAIISANEVLLLWDDVLTKEDEATEEEIEDKKIENHLSEAALVVQMNDPVKILDTGIDSFDTPVGESVEITVTKPPRNQSKFSMNLNSVFSACKLLKHRLLDRAIGGDREELKSFGGAIMKGGAPTICNFHPKLPMYILLFQLHKTLANENYKDSLDFELALQTYDFLLQMEQQLNDIKDMKDKCDFALSIRDFFFINNVVSDKIKVKKVPLLPPKILSFMGLLTTEFCGALNETYFGDLEDRRESINNPVFTSFITRADFTTPFDLVIDQIKYEDFVNAVSLSARNAAQQIVDDRGKERDALITKYDYKKDIFEKDEGKYNDDLSDLKQEFGVNTIFSNQLIKSFGGRKTRRNRKRRTRRPSKNVVGKKTRKRSRK